MKKKVIIGLLWAAFGLIAVHFVFMIGGTLLQSWYQKLVYYEPGDELPFYFPVDYFIYNIFRMLLMLLSCIVISNGLNKEQKGIAMEIVSVVLFSGAFGFLAQIWGEISFRLVVKQGSRAILARSIVTNFLSFINPISVVAISLFLVAAGMSITYKKMLK